MPDDTDPRVETAKNLKHAAPPALHDKPIWLLWKLEKTLGEKKARKVPYRIDGKVRKGVQGNAHDRAGKGTIDQALTAYRRGDYHGIGIAPHAGAGVVAIDLDKCVGDDNMPLPHAQEIIERMGTYCELSPSGTGLHLIALGDLSSAKSMDRWGKGQNIEVFGTSGFITFTGLSLAEVAPDAQQVNGFTGYLADVLAKPQKPNGEAHAALHEAPDARAVRDLRAALKHLKADDYDTWIDVGMALATAGNEGQTLWLEWSATSEKFDGNEAGAKWAGFKPGVTHWKSVFVKAKAAGWGGESEAAQVADTQDDEAAPEPEPEPTYFVEVDLSDRSRAEAPKFVWAERLPLREVAALGAHGGMGKTLLMLQLAICVVLGRPFLGHATRQGPVVFFTGEDDGERMRYVVHRICQAWGLEAEDLAGLHILDASDMSPVLFKEVRAEDGAVEGKATMAMGALAVRVAQVKPVLVVVDNSTMTYDSNENDRVRRDQFFQMFKKMARRGNCAVMMLTHVDKASARGTARGTDTYSGSSAGNNSVRDRWAMVPGEAGCVVLRHEKWSQASKQADIKLRYSEGVLVEDVMSPEEREGGQEAVRRVLVQRIAATKEPISTGRTAARNPWAVLNAGLKLKRADLYEALEQCEKEGWLERREVRKNRNTSTTWAVTAAGTVWADAG